MTRKDYIKFADMIRIEVRQREPEISPAARACFTRFVADIFERDSSQFDRERFYRACEPKGGKSD